MMTIDECYKSVINELTTTKELMTITNTLRNLKSNDDRVALAYGILESFNKFPKCEIVTKSGDVSLHYRNLGNQCYQKARYYQAWQYYNLSLLNAPIGSEFYSTALSNRSAVFASLKKFKECLHDIQDVFSMQYPTKLKEKLLKRQIQCNEALSEVNNQSNEYKFEIERILTMKSTGHNKYLCASNKVEVVHSEQMGRHIVAREDIKVGEVLAIEEPYFALLLKPQFLFSCGYCLSRHCNLIPCDSCCYTLYCSVECKNKAWKEYHEIECPLMTSLIEMEFTKLELLALRIVIKARREHPDWESLFRTIDEADTSVNSEHHGCVKVDGKFVYDSKYYASIHTLATNIEKRTLSDIFQKAITAAVFLHMLDNNTKFLDCEDYVKKIKIRKCVSAMLLLHTMTSPTNMHGISTNIQTAQGNYVEGISLASAPYAFHSLLNHSCAPNIVRYSELGTSKMTLFALRPIKKGMQLFDNYGSHHALEDRETRQNTLNFQYKFDCQCEACVHNWPTYAVLACRMKNIPSRIKRKKEIKLTPQVIESLQKGDIGTAVRLFAPLCELLEELEPYTPCAEQSDCQESLKQSLAIMEGYLPHGFSQLIYWSAVPPKV